LLKPRTQRENNKYLSSSFLLTPKTTRQMINIVEIKTSKLILNPKAIPLFKIHKPEEYIIKERIVLITDTKVEMAKTYFIFILF